jgi:YD repeat-containing protein
MSRSTTGTYPAQSLYVETGYKYDLLGNLVEVKDADTPVNVTSMEYDPLSRKVEMHDPDMGVWLYPVHDGNGNLRQQQDANGNIMEFDYDALNRLTAKTCSNCPPESTIDVTYHCDEGPPQCC